MMSITCLAGFYVHPEQESLVETMLWNSQGGAAAGLAATSLTLPGDQQVWVKAFTEVLLESQGELTLGEILLLTQNRIRLTDVGVQEVIETFLLFGDPALRIPGAEG